MSIKTSTRVVYEKIIQKHYHMVVQEWPQNATPNYCFTNPLTQRHRYDELICMLRINMLRAVHSLMAEGASGTTRMPENLRPRTRETRVSCYQKVLRILEMRTHQLWNMYNRVMVLQPTSFRTLLDRTEHIAYMRDMCIKSMRECTSLWHTELLSVHSFASPRNMVIGSIGGCHQPQQLAEQQQAQLQLQFELDEIFSDMPPEDNAELNQLMKEQQSCEPTPTLAHACLGGSLKNITDFELQRAGLSDGSVKGVRVPVLLGPLEMAPDLMMDMLVQKYDGLIVMIWDLYHERFVQFHYDVKALPAGCHNELRNSLVSKSICATSKLLGRQIHHCERESAYAAANSHIKKPGDLIKNFAFVPVGSDLTNAATVMMAEENKPSFSVNLLTYDMPQRHCEHTDSRYMDSSCEARRLWGHDDMLAFVFKAHKTSPEEQVLDCWRRLPIQINRQADELCLPSMYIKPLCNCPVDSNAVISHGGVMCPRCHVLYHQTICPFSLSHMSLPVKNMLCRHLLSYDFVFVVQMLASSHKTGKMAQCPVYGCKTPLTMQTMVRTSWEPYQKLYQDPVVDEDDEGYDSDELAAHDPTVNISSSTSTNNNMQHAPLIIV